MTLEAGEMLLDARGLHKRFNALVALDGVDFSVRANEAVGVVGPNGAGKTTLLSVLVGAHAPTAGSVRLARPGRDRACRPPSAVAAASPAPTRFRGRSRA